MVPSEVIACPPGISVIVPKTLGGGEFAPPFPLPVAVPPEPDGAVPEGGLTGSGGSAGSEG